MEQLTAPDPGRRTVGGLGPRMRAFIIFDALLLLAFVVVLGLFVTGTIGGSEPGGAEPAEPGTAALSPSAGSTGSESPDPASTEPAVDASTFALPSGNIACEITADSATCTIANSSAAPPADASCTGDVGHVLTVTAEGAQAPCVEGALPGAAAEGTPVLEYGQSKTVGDFTCTSSSTGVTCKHDPSSKGFQLAKAGSTLF